MWQVAFPGLAAENRPWHNRLAHRAAVPRGAWLPNNGARLKNPGNEAGPHVPGPPEALRARGGGVAPVPLHRVA